MMFLPSGLFLYHMILGRVTELARWVILDWFEPGIFLAADWGWLVELYSEMECHFIDFTGRVGRVGAQEGI